MFTTILFGSCFYFIMYFAVKIIHKNDKTKIYIYKTNCFPRRNEKMNIYQDIAARTGGEIYIGVVGPVRTGKSTFIKRFAEEFIFPNMADDYNKERLRDELPQSGAGRIIMTNQPKFVPDKAVEVVLEDNVRVKTRLIDCVGYLIDGANGHTEDGLPRMVRTPWFDKDIPFEEAADIGTHKVIENHSTVGIVVTSDGSITDIPRENYVQAEQRTVNELKLIGKPFAVIINSKEPLSSETQQLRAELSEKYGAPVHAVDVTKLDAEGIGDILGSILYEFPVKNIKFNVPDWIFSLEITHWLLGGVVDFVKAVAAKTEKIKNTRELDAFSLLGDESKSFVTDTYLTDIDLGEGSAEYSMHMSQSVFYKVLSERCGCEVANDYELFDVMKDFMQIKADYERIEPALKSVRQTGYGMVPPSLEEMKLEEPELVRHGSKFGVKLKASAPSLHFLRADIETIVSPIIGTEKQSEELVRFLLDEFETDTQRIWKTDIFGKSLHDLVKEGLSGKLSDMPEDVRYKLQETIQRIINEGTEGVMCIIL